MSGETQLAEEGELDAKGRTRSTCLSPNLMAWAKAEKCRDEDEAAKAKIEVKNGVEYCTRMEVS